MDEDESGLVIADPAEEEEEDDDGDKETEEHARYGAAAPVKSDMADILERCYRVVKESKDATGRPRCTLFLDLPEKSLYPDYYQIIKEPISLGMIRSKMRAGRYRSLQHLHADFVRMFKNAMTYNADGSEVYEDARVMKAELESEIQRLHPNFVPLPDDDDEQQEMVLDVPAEPPKKRAREDPHVASTTTTTNTTATTTTTSTPSANTTTAVAAAAVAAATKEKDTPKASSEAKPPLVGVRKVNLTPKAYHCTECGSGFSRPNNLKRHMQQLHGVGGGKSSRTDSPALGARPAGGASTPTPAAGPGAGVAAAVAAAASATSTPAAGSASATGGTPSQRQRGGDGSSAVTGTGVGVSASTTPASATTATLAVPAASSSLARSGSPVVGRSSPAGERQGTPSADGSTLAKRRNAKESPYPLAAQHILETYSNMQPMHYREITKKAMELGMINPLGRTPENTMHGQLNRHDAFIPTGRGFYALTKWKLPGLPERALTPALTPSAGVAGAADMQPSGAPTVLASTVLLATANTSAPPVTETIVAAGADEVDEGEDGAEAMDVAEGPNAPDEPVAAFDTARVGGGAAVGTGADAEADAGDAGDAEGDDDGDGSDSDDQSEELDESSDETDEETRAHRELMLSIPLSSLHKTSHTGIAYALQGRQLASMTILRRLMNYKDESASTA